MYSLSIVSVIAVYSYAHWSLTWSPRPLSFQYSSFLPSFYHVALPLCHTVSAFNHALSLSSVTLCLPLSSCWGEVYAFNYSWSLVVNISNREITHRGLTLHYSAWGRGQRWQYTHYLLMCSWGHKLSISRKCCDFSFNFPSTVVTKHFYPCCCHSHQTKILM